MATLQIMRVRQLRVSLPRLTKRRSKTQLWARISIPSTNYTQVDRQVYRSLAPVLREIEPLTDEIAQCMSCPIG